MNQHAPQSAIGILDSGVGGLTVVREVFRQLPKERVLYFGDTLRCPYGPRSAQEVKRFTLEIVHFLSRLPLKALVIACNTATAVALQAVREQFSIPVLGVVEPGARAAISVSKTGRIGVIGTEGTIRSAAYKQALKRIDPDLFVYSHACPSLVPLVESGGGASQEAQQIVARALLPLQAERLDSLILGCTHYPLISEAIQEVLGVNTELINSAEETARELSTVLHHKGLLADGRRFPTGDHYFFVSGQPLSFRRIAETWLARPIEVERVTLPTLTTNTIVG